VTKLKSCLIVLIIFSAQATYGQNAKLYVVKDKDTLNSKVTGVKIFLDIENQLVAFSNSDSLIYPKNIIPDSINSIVVVYQYDTLSFYNFKERVKVSTIPKLIRMQLPFYGSLFDDKRNMYFTIDSYPFENDDRKETASLNMVNSKIPITKMTIVELYYQVKEIQLFEPRIKNNR